MVLKLECFRKEIRSTLKVLKCGLEKMSLNECAKKDEVSYSGTEDMNILHRTKERKDNWIGYICFMNTLLKERQKG
jgi:hypothetical protein